jgi:hypothetical protein
VRRVLGVVLVAAVCATGMPRAVAEGSYGPPVEGPVVDHFRPPATTYGPGNRGLDFRTEPGDTVRAAADGEVVFAGQVGSSHHVVVLHPDGLRTSYSYLIAVDVRRGDEVRRGDAVGRAGHEVHFGVRAGARYLDPEPLLAGREPEVHLIPVVERRPGSLASELAGLVAGLGRSARQATAAGVEWVVDGAGAAIDGAGAYAATVRDQLVALAEVVDHYRTFPQRAIGRLHRIQLFLDAQRRCTPPGRPPPPAPGRGRIAVLVAGLGSTSDEAAIHDLDTAALGYAPDQVAVFSYAGGQAGGDRAIAGVPVNPYSADQANGDLEDAARRFRELLVSIRLAHPGVAVDVLAHSQGGLVARAGLGAPGDATDPRLPEVAHVVTLGSPHLGADLATANGALGLSPVGLGGQIVLDQVGVPATAEAVAQLAERSSFVAGLKRRPLPAGARVTSVAAAGDVVVPALQTALAGATNVLVPVDGLGAHDELPGSPQAAREVALALGDEGPTCRDPSGELRTAWLIGLGETILGGALGAAGVALSNPAGHG